MMAMAVGAIAPAPSPCKQRKEISEYGLQAIPQRAELTVKRAKLLV
jgi:hypothetical protein